MISHLGHIAAVVTAAITLAVAAPCFAQSAGTWRGTIAGPGYSIPLVLRVQSADSTHFAGSVDSPAQGMFDVGGPIHFAADSFRFTPRRIGAVFVGTRSKGGDTLSGEWSQAGVRLPLVMIRTSNEFVRKRPQDPIPPFPYDEREIKITTTDGVVIKGTLSVPRASAKVPGVVLISGSGPQDRDGSIMGHKPFRVIADYLSRRDIAVLRYDERGTGLSSGDFAQATTLDFAKDAEAAVSYLLRQPEIDPSRVGLIGHSEGGLVAPIVANKIAATGFVVLLAAPGVHMRDIATQQAEAMVRAAGFSEPQITRRTEAARQIMELFTSDSLPTDFPLRARAILEESLKDIPASLRQTAVELALRQYSTPWVQFALRYDPRAQLQALRVPTLALNGTLDTQVPYAPNLAGIRSAVAPSLLRAIPLKGLNHLFQTAATGALSEYGVIEETFAPAALEAIADWIMALPR